MKCSVADCERTSEKRGMCNKHYKRVLRHGNANYTSRRPSHIKCEVVNCEEPAKSNGLCNMHYARHYKGNPIGSAEKLRREQGTGTIHVGGYKELCINGEKILEHRLIAEKALGKKLPKGAVVHHLNGNPLDNRSCNLVVCPDQTYHMLLHTRQKQFGYDGPSL